MPVLHELGSGGRLGMLALLHLRLRRAGGNLDLELDQELHAVLLLLLETRRNFTMRRMASRPRLLLPGRDAHVLHAARLTALAVTASRITPATMSGCESIKKCDAPSTSVTAESARSYWK